MPQHINATDKPLILVGSSTTMEKYADMCNVLGIQIHGCIDSDYFGNKSELYGVPVIDTEAAFEQADKLDYYQRNFNFFCATNWAPEKDAVTTRNREKRQRLIDLLDQKQLSVISLIDPTAHISRSANIGRGVFVDGLAQIEPGVVLGDYTMIYSFTCVGHHTRVDRNSVLQRFCSIGGDIHFEENCFLGVNVKALKTSATFGKDTFVHECLYIRRGTMPGEVVSINGSNMSRVYSEQQRHII
jgi:hypothetical protein